MGSFTVSNLVTDGGVNGGNLLFSAYDGTVYRTTTTGALLNSWSTGFSHVGVTSDGTDIFTTEGDGGNLIDVWSASGLACGISQHLSPGCTVLAMTPRLGTSGLAPRTTCTSYPRAAACSRH